MRLLVRFILLSGSLVTASALAEQPPATLTYLAPSDCPDRAAFWHEIVARSSHLAQRDPEALELFINARVSRTDARYAGMVLLSDALGRISEREVTGPTCADVTAALALVVAVAFDGLVLETRTPEPQPPAPIATVPQSPAPVANGPPTSVALGPTVGAHSAVAPEIVPIVGLSASYGQQGRWGATDVRVEGLLGLGSTERVSASGTNLGNAQFLWLSTRSVVCAFQLGHGATSFGPCMLFELGALRGKGSSATGQRSSTGWWVAPGVGLNARLRTDPLSFRLTGGFVRPLVRDTFVFRPEPTVFRPPAVGLLAELEISWIFF